MNIPRLLSSDSLCGTDVKNPQGQDIGKVSDLMINLRTGKVEYAVLDFGGFLGIGNKLFAVPYGAFAVDTKDDEMVLDVDKEYLEKAPGFDKENWPNFASPQFADEHNSYYRNKISSH